MHLSSFSRSLARPCYHCSVCCSCPAGRMCVICLCMRMDTSKQRTNCLYHSLGYTPVHDTRPQQYAHVYLHIRNVCSYVHMFIFMKTCVHVYACRGACTYVYSICTCVRSITHGKMCIRICVYMYTHVYVYVRMCMFMLFALDNCTMQPLAYLKGMPATGLVYTM